MTYPNLLTFQGNGLVQYASNSAINALSEVVLERLVSDNAVGTLTTNATFATTIGTFTDNFVVGEPGSVGAANTANSSIVKTFFQNLDANNVGSVTATPVEWNSDQNSVKVLDGGFLDQLADYVVSYLVNEDGPGSYFLGNNAPTDGGTWSEAFSIVDKLSTTANDSPLSYVWVKTQGTTSLTDSILKVDESGLKFMTSPEIESLVAVVKQRIIDTEIGTYALQQSAPGTGTWEARGTIDDSQYEVADGSYIGTAFVGYVGARSFFRITFSPQGFTGTRFYSGSFTFAGTEEVSYLGPTVGANTFNTETITLWRRIA